MKISSKSLRNIDGKKRQAEVREKLTIFTIFNSLQLTATSIDFDEIFSRYTVYIYGIFNVYR